MFSFVFRQITLASVSSYTVANLPQITIYAFNCLNRNVKSYLYNRDSKFNDVSSDIARLELMVGLQLNHVYPNPRDEASLRSCTVFLYNYSHYSTIIMKCIVTY